MISIVPSARWLVGAAVLALTAPLAIRWPAWSLWIVGLDLAWVVLLILDAWRAAGNTDAALEVTREAPPAFSVGRSLPVRYRWANHTRRRLELRVRESVPAVLGGTLAQERRIALAPGAVAWETATLQPARRGKARGGSVHLRALSPWGLAWRQTQREVPWNVTVYPNLVQAALRALPSQLQRRREAGLRSVRHIGEGRAFESLREFVTGDDTRVIDWKATARRGKPMARQYEDERRQQVLIVVDAGRLLTADIGGRARLEYIVDAALQLAYAAVEHDDNVGLLVFADTVQHYVAPARGQRALRQILDALASTEGKLVEPDYPSAFAWLAARNRKRALTVVFTDVIDRTASDALVAHVGSLRPRHLPLAVTLRNPELERLATARTTTVTEAFEKAAAEELLQAREEALTDLRRRGVLIVDVAPAGAAKAVVEQYTQLKRKGRL